MEQTPLKTANMRSLKTKQKNLANKHQTHISARTGA